MSGDFHDPNADVMNALVTAHEGGVDASHALREALRACATFAIHEGKLIDADFAQLAGEAWVAAYERKKR